MVSNIQFFFATKSWEIIATSLFRRLLDAVHKIRYQKQRPNVDRISACVRMHHPQYSNEAVQAHLDSCCDAGVLAKVVNKGLVSYRDPGSAPGRGHRTLHVSSRDTDLSKVFSRAVRELHRMALEGEDDDEDEDEDRPPAPEVVDLAAVEAHVRAGYAVEVRKATF